MRKISRRSLLAFAAAGSAMGQRRTLDDSGARIRLFVDGTPDFEPEAIDRSILRAAQAVGVYYGRFPFPGVRLRISIREGSSRIRGTTYGGERPFIHLRIGQQVAQRDLEKDWTLTHEFVHLAFPDMGGEHRWIEEGLATYVEPVARAQAGQLQPRDVWLEWMRSLPKGQPEAGDLGLDHTDTWARTYWGGALFSFVAEMRIREASRNRKGLQDALRGICNAGGLITERWPLERTLDVGDAATGFPVLTSLYREMKDTPVRVDLRHMWANLGLDRAPGAGVAIQEGAPWGDVRDAITARR